MENWCLRKQEENLTFSENLELLFPLSNYYF